MAKLMSPQKRAFAPMLAMIEARYGAGLPKAADWFERGWNPFLPQENASWREKKTAFDIMIEHPRWHPWLLERKEALRPLIAKAFPSTANGLVDAGDPLSAAASRSYGGDSDLLRLLLNIGVDPASLPKSNDTLPALNAATRTGAEALLAAGCPSARQGQRRSAWESWCERACTGHQIDLPDLDWMAGHCPPDATHPHHLPGQVAIVRGRTEIMSRLAEIGAGPAAFGLEKQPDLINTISRICRQADSHGMLEALVGICGKDRVLDAFTAKAPLGGSSMHCCLYEGRVRCLCSMERIGLLDRPGCDPATLAIDCSVHWSQSHSEAYQRYRDSVYYGTPSPAGAVWALSRIPAADAGKALTALSQFVKANHMQAARAVQTCASKGFLPDSGPNSLMALYEQGALWVAEATPDQKSFAEFTALCEGKAFKKAFAKPAKKTTIARRL